MHGLRGRDGEREKEREMSLHLGDKMLLGEMRACTSALQGPRSGASEVAMRYGATVCTSPIRYGDMSKKEFLSDPRGTRRNLLLFHMRIHTRFLQIGRKINNPTYIYASQHISVVLRADMCIRKCSLMHVT